jgi:hypothetical protein
MRLKTGTRPQVLLSLAILFSTVLTAKAQTLSTSSWNFGNQVINTNSATKGIVLKNSQTIPLTISGISTSGNFSQTSNCPLSPNTLAAGSTCMISVVFTPAASGTNSGVLTVNDNAANSPQTTTLTGNGMLAVAFPTTVKAFASQLVTTTSAAQTTTLKNNQSVALTISSISTSGVFAQTSTCPISPNTLASGGTCTISVTFTPTALGATTGTLTVSDNASTSPQTENLSGTGSLAGLTAITVAPTVPTRLFIGSQLQLTATGTFPNNVTMNVTDYVNWTSSVPAFAPVSSTGLVQALAAGQSIIGANYAKVSGSGAVINVAAPAATSIAITPTNLTEHVGAYEQFSAIVHYNNGSTNDSTTEVSWSSTSPGIATVSPSGLVSAVAAGSTTIQAFLGSLTGSTPFTVNQTSCTAPPAGLAGWWTGDGNTVDLGGDNSGTLQNGAAYGTGEVAQAFSFTGNGSSVLVNSPVYSPTAGTLMFWFNSTGGGVLTGGYAGGQNRAPGFLIDSLGNLNWEFGNLYAQSVSQVNPNQWYQAALTYSTINSETAVNVYLNGVLVADAVADANTSWNPQVLFGAYMGAQEPSFVGSMDEITIFNQALTAAQIQTIYHVFSAGMCKPTLKSVAVTPANPTLAPGLTFPFDAVGTYSNSTVHDLTSSATWSTASIAVATINANGLATAVANGTTTVSAAMGSVQGSTGLSVAPSLVSIQVNPQTPVSDVGTAVAFTATGTFSNGIQQNLSNSVNWTTLRSGVASISSNGTATTVAAGQTTITATAGSVNGSSLLTVNSPSLASIVVSPLTPTIASGATQQFTATGIFSDGSQQNLTTSVSWSSSSSTVANIASSGLASAVGGGQVTITANLGGVAGTASLTVTTGVLTAIQISPQSSSIIIGGSQQFSAQATYSNGTSANVSASATWTSSANTAAAMSTTSPGLAVSTGTGATRISASYGGLTDSTVLTVQDQLASIAIQPATFTLTIGQSEQFNAIGTYASGITQNLTGSVTWNSSTPSVAGISSGGLATSGTPGLTGVTASLGSVTASANLTVGAANVIGQWNTLSGTMPINPIHVALLATGQVLVIAGSGACPPNIAGCPTGGPPYDPPDLGALLINPASGEIISQFPTAWDMFCNGMVFLQDGAAFIAGGNLQYNPFTGLPLAAIFDPTTDTFTNLPSMAQGRWYPTALSLGDGTVMVFGGLNQTGVTNPTVEIYTPGTGWSTQYTAPFTPDLYPRMHLLPSGMVLYSGSLPKTKIFDPSTTTWNTNGANTNYAGARLYGTSILLPLTPANNYDPKVIIMGGGTPATNTTEIIDMGAATPAWVYGPPMSQPRIEMNAVILPTGQVLALGGSLNNEDESTASLNADLYSPATNTISSAGANAFARLYHSVALLLPDASVWVAGGNPTQGDYEHHMEIYQPAYLFNPDGTLATQPSITSAPTSATYGSSFSVTAPDAANISSVVLVRPGTVTHAFGMDQREVGLAFTSGTGTLTVTAPPNGYIAPPGYYMLFLVSNTGVPSVATFIQITGTQTQTASAISAGPVSQVVTSSSSNTLVQAPSAAVSRNQGGSKPFYSVSPDQSKQPASATGSTQPTGIDVTGTWSGMFFSKHSNFAPFKVTVVINRNSHGQLVGTSTLNSACLKNAQLQVSVADSKIVLAGADQQGDNITVKATIDKTGRLLNSSYIVDGSASGRCETDDGAGTLTRR